MKILFIFYGKSIAMDELKNILGHVLLRICAEYDWIHVAMVMPLLTEKLSGLYQECKTG